MKYMQSPIVRALTMISLVRKISNWRLDTILTRSPRGRLLKKLTFSTSLLQVPITMSCAKSLSIFETRSKSRRVLAPVWVGRKSTRGFGSLWSSSSEIGIRNSLLNAFGRVPVAVCVSCIREVASPFRRTLNRWQFSLWLIRPILLKVFLFVKRRLDWYLFDFTYK